MKLITKAALLCLGVLFGVSLYSQTANIGGIINNTFSQVNSVDAINNLVNVASTAGFSVGDTVLLIQMQGAVSDVSNSSTFGDVTNFNNAGNYEINIVCDVDGTGNNITLQNLLSRSYDNGANAGVQLIKVETYENAIVTSPLLANPWDGVTGGVLAFQTTGWLRLRPGNSIDIDDLGFRGGDHLIIPDGCGCSFGGDPQHTNFFYPYGSDLGAPKGEGISRVTTNREAGKGHQSNGGGGGNDHNGGGGGGANYGDGGDGGSPCSTRSCFLGAYCRGFHPGVGGQGLASEINNNKVFLGGGGGSGDDNGGAGSGGTPGGGIAIIMADSIFGNAGGIFARGSQAPTGAGDGTGGGGAGGSVLIQARTIHPTSPITINVSGGNGGISSWTGPDYNSKGKGGGGGGGVFCYSGTSIPANITTNLSGGAAGFEAAAASACTGDNGGAQAGGVGAAVPNLSLPFNSTIFGSCLLPVEYGFITAEKAGSMAKIDWQTFAESNSSHFDVERSWDGKAFEAIGTVPSIGDQGGLYTYTDVAPRGGINFYRLRQFDQDGSNRISKVVAVSFGEGEVVLTKLFPNPVQASEPLNLELGLPSDQSSQVAVFDALGKPVFQDQIAAGSTVQEYSIPTTNWSGGIYFLKVTTSGKQQLVRRVTVIE